MTDRRRLWRAENQEISITQNPFGSRYYVEGTRGMRYTVDLKKPSCECPDWKKRSSTGGCKHILKVKLENGIVEPLRSEKTNTNPPQSRSQSNYSKGWKSLSEKTKNGITGNVNVVVVWAVQKEIQPSTPIIYFQNRREEKIGLRI